MNPMRMLRRYARQFRHDNGQTVATREPEMIAAGWDKYAREWKAAEFAVVPGHQLHYVGDEWTAEDVSDQRTTTYGLSPDVVARFDEYLSSQLLDPYLCRHQEEGLEIGPGGGRVTALLAPRTGLLHVADASQAMLAHLKRRFSRVPTLRYHLIDGKTLPALRAASLDYVIAFDVFVHFEPRLVYWYLRQISNLLKPGGTGIIHYAHALTPIGWQQFENDLEMNLEHRTHFASFGVMCPPLMAKFLEALGLDATHVDLGIIPRDAVAVFRKRG